MAITMIRPHVLANNSQKNRSFQIAIGKIYRCTTFIHFPYNIESLISTDLTSESKITISAYIAALIFAKSACLSSLVSHRPFPPFLEWINSPVSTNVISKLPVVPRSAVNVVDTTPLPNSSSKARQRAS